MATLQFNVRDAELLYAFPKPPSDIATVIRCFMFLNRTAPPTYDELTSCLTKALKVGIIREEAGKFVVEKDWYDRIHMEDSVSENEIESMLDFEEHFVNVEFVVVTNAVSALSREDFNSILKALL